MKVSFARLAAWGVLIGLLAVAAAAFLLRAPAPAPEEGTQLVPRQVTLDVEPDALRTGASTTLAVTARDDGGTPVSAWGNARLDAWMVRSDLAYLEHVVPDRAGASSSVSFPVSPTQPGTYRLVVTGVRDGVVSVGAATLAVGGAAQDVPPDELSAGRAGLKLVLSTIPDSGAIRAGQPVSLTFIVSRAGMPVSLDEQDGARGRLVAFREDGRLFVQGEPLPDSLLPSDAATAFTLGFPEPGKYRVFLEFSAGGREYTEARWIDVLPASG